MAFPVRKPSSLIAALAVSNEKNQLSDQLGKRALDLRSNLKGLKSH